MIKKVLGVALAIALACSSLAGCGGTESKDAANTVANTSADTTADTTANNTVDTAVNTTADTVANTAADTTAANTTEDMVADTTTANTTKDMVADTTASAAGSNDLAEYSSVIDALNAGQHYAIVSIRQGEGEERMSCLLVAGGTFNYTGSDQAAVEAIIYYVSKNGEVISAGNVHSTGSNYPLAVSTDGYLMYYYDKVMKKVYVDKESGELVVKESAGIKYSKDGDATYSWYSSDTGKEITVPDDEKINALMDEYIGAETVSFKAGGVARDGTPKLSGAV